ncbi:MAG: FISUMP domain-containing protein, partial [Bacteroidota bacterium]
TATGLPAGVTAVWASNVITISGIPAASGTFNYTIPLTGGCGSVNAMGTITVSACTPNTAGTASPITLIVNTALTPSITIATTGATGIGTATGLPAGVTAVWASNVITISGTPSASGTFNYTIPFTGGCGSVDATGTITVSACPTATITDNGMNTYNTVSIGTQCWMKENLRVRRYNDGTEIRFDASGTSTGTSSQTWSGMGREYGAYTIYSHDSTATPSNLTSYGYLYNWYAVKGIASIGSTTYKNICPSGWHVPSDSDWNKLVKFINSLADTTINGLQSSPAGTKLKKNDALWTTNTGNTGTDNYGFSGLPGGYRGIDGSFISIRNVAVFWCATEYDVDEAWNRVLYYNGGYVKRSTDGKKSLGGSIRCILD